MSENSANRKAALWIGVVFLLGAALGGLTGYAFARHAVSAANAPLPEPVRRAQRVEQLTRELGLSSAQAQEIDTVLLQRHTEAKTIHDQMDAQLDQVHQNGRNQIRAVLTAEQKPKFEEFLRRLDSEKKKNAR
jgi:hypothetical protein